MYNKLKKKNVELRVLHFALSVYRATEHKHVLCTVTCDSHCAD